MSKLLMAAAVWLVLWPVQLLQGQQSLIYLSLEGVGALRNRNRKTLLVESLPNQFQIRVR